MDAVAHIKKLSKSKGKRSDTLIVPKICSKTRTLDTEAWEHPVDFAFRDALDIKLTPRTKVRKDANGETILNDQGKPLKTTTNKWTQGPLLAFKEGDLIDGLDVVISASSMGWDPSINEMYFGHVTLGKISQLGQGKSIVKDPTWSGTQIDFLELLITGETSNAKYC